MQYLDRVSNSNGVNFNDSVGEKVFFAMLEFQTPTE